jgi:hypothetical protein
MQCCLQEHPLLLQLLLQAHPALLLLLLLHRGGPLCF